MWAEDIRTEEQEVSSFLQSHFPYYSSLDEKWKDVFTERVIRFARMKTFVGQKGFEINNRVKILISASAVQLTLGLTNWELSYFGTIILFPSDFYNSHSQLGLKGETDIRGFVSFSWKSFMAGYKIPDDNLNLGLHEFTHALRFNGIRGESTDYFFDNYFEKWYSYAKNTYLELKNNRPSIFRKYGGTNINEFLSVVIEHYFESPEEFVHEHPTLYSATAALLNQKTNGTKTFLNIRNEELRKLDKTMPFTEFKAESEFSKSNAIYVLIIFSLTAVFTAIKTGPVSFPALFLACICVLAFVAFDYSFNKVQFMTDSLTVNKGLFLFRNRINLNILSGRLVQARFHSYGKKQTIELVYFDQNGSFDEIELETALTEVEQQRLIRELEQNFVWVKNKISV